MNCGIWPIHWLPKRYLIVDQFSKWTFVESHLKCAVRKVVWEFDR